MKKLDKYLAGTLWIRDQHEVRIAEAQHLPVLFSARENYLSDFEYEELSPIQKSLPPPSATVKDFIGRKELLVSLWEWFIFGDEPRIYLHGPGGSGKSTIAFEFAKTIANEAGRLRLPGSEKIDYVIYLSGKETELQSVKGNIKVFELQDFDSAETQYKQILFHSGITSNLEENYNPDDVDSQLSELFDNYNGLLVLDDIDALARRKVDTGEENIFLKIVRAKKRTRVIYTTRFEPSYALRSAFKVSGLDFDLELPSFVKACCEQFQVPPISSAELPQIASKTHNLPLLIETVIGLRRDCSSYSNALRIFQDKGGDEARIYLYKREYERLEATGKSRSLLAALLLLDSSVTFDTLANILPFPEEQIRDAISESTGIFLSTLVADNGESQFGLAAPCVKLIRLLSRNLEYFAPIERAVGIHKQESLRLSPDEIVRISRFQRKLRIGQTDDLIAEAESLHATDPIRVTSDFCSLVGQAYAKSSKPNFTKAREYFRNAFNKKCRDIFMMRAWFYVEIQHGFSLDVAEEVCLAILQEKNLSSRYHAEFLAKLGSCLVRQANQYVVTEHTKAVGLFQRALVSYFDSITIGRDVPEIDNIRHNEWLARTAELFFRNLHGDIEPLFKLVDILVNGNHDIDINAARKIFGSLRALAVHPEQRIRIKAAGLANRSLKVAKRISEKQPEWGGIRYICNIMEYIIAN